jgi:hypothetical protein
MTMYAQVDADGYVLQTIGRLDPPDYQGDIEPPPDSTDGTTYYHVTTALPWRERPSKTARMVWDGVAAVWEETASLDELKVAKREEITAQRLLADADHFIYAGKAIRTADKDMMDLLIADARIRKGFPINWPGGWKAIDNSYVPITTIAEWDAFFIAMYDTGIDNFNHSQGLKMQIDAATTPEEVAAIQW